MRNLILIICLAVLLGGCNYIGIVGGKDDEFDSANLTLEYGSPPPDEIKSEPGKRDWMLTGGMAYIDNYNPEIGAFVKLGIEVLSDTGFFVNVIGGVTFMEEARGYVSPYGYWQPTEGEIEIYGMFGGGVTYFINDKDVCLLTAYDNRRGFTAGIGFRF